MKSGFTLVLIYSLAFTDAKALLNTPNLSFPQDNAAMVSTLPTLSLSFVSGATHYEFEISLNASLSQPTKLKSTGGGNPFVLSQPLAFNTRYYWRGRAKSSTDSSLWSTVRTFTTDTSINFIYPSNNFGPMNMYAFFYWTRNSYFKEYVLEIDSSNGFNSSQLFRTRIKDTFDGMSYVFYQKALGKFGDTLFWRFKGINPSDSMRWLPVRKFWTMDTVRIISPLNGQLRVSTSYVFQWTFDQSLDYQLELDTTAQFNSYKRKLHQVDGAVSNSYIVKNLEYDQTYYWRLRGCSIADTTRWSYTRKFTVHGMKNGVFIQNSGNLTPETDFNWLAVDSSLYYNFQADISPGFNSAKLKDSIRNAKYIPSKPFFNRTLTLKNLEFGQSFYLRVRPMHAEDTGAWCNVKVMTVPASAALYSPVNNATEVESRPLFQWQILKGVKQYRFQRDTSAAFNSPLLVDTLVTASFRPNQKTLFGKVYYWRIQMMHDEDTSAWSNTFKFESKKAPVLISPVSSIFLNQGVALKLDWDSMPGSTGFEVQYDTASGFTSGELKKTYTPGDSTYLQINDLYFGTLYYWRVRAITGSDTSAWSAEWKFPTMNKVRLDLPRNRDSGISFGTLDWNSINGSKGYHIMLSEDSLFTQKWESINQAVNPFFHVFNPNPTKFNTVYYWKVRVFHSKDSSEWSDVWRFKTRPRNPVILTAPPDKQINVSPGLVCIWQKHSNAVGYFFAYADNKEMNQAVYSVEINNLKTLSLKPNTTYYWYVIARNSMGVNVSDTSDIFSFTTAPNFKPVSLISPQNNTKGLSANVTFTWQALPGATYEIEVGEDSLFNVRQAFNVSVSSVSINNFMTSKLYYWRVRAKNSFVTGLWSDTFNFTVGWLNGIHSTDAGFISVYPNPASEQLFIKMSEGNDIISLSLYTIDGRELMTDTSLQSGLVELDVSGLNEDVYLLKIICSDAVYTRRIVIKR